MTIQTTVCLVFSIFLNRLPYSYTKYVSHSSKRLNNDLFPQGTVNGCNRVANGYMLFCSGSAHTGSAALLTGNIFDKLVYLNMVANCALCRAYCCALALK